NPSHLDVCSDSLISGQQSSAAWMLGVSPNSFVDIRKVSLATDFDTQFKQARLNLFTGTNQFPAMYYGSEHSGTPTYFARYVVFTGLIESGVLIPRDQLVKVESHVLYNKGTMTGEVVLESFIGNY
ncbi:MAG: hypothetical protein WCO66_04420, partial [Candidatus Absconditabacteria bacterium]